MRIESSPSRDLPRGFCYAVLGLIVLLFAVRNLPWHLDDYDQAKQAFTSYEMVKGSEWLFQHTPTGRVATKPPLAGWISAALYGLGSGWEIAWRLPSFAAALLVLLTLWRTGSRLSGGHVGGLLAAGMFGLNFFTPRLATLVRTDMLLGAFIFFAGWLVLEKVRTAAPWTTGERCLLFALVLGTLLTKGPIAYAFLAPGLLAYYLITGRLSSDGRSGHAWAGWWCWLAPMMIFIGWVVLGLLRDPEFKEQVIFREFLGRFTVGESARHNNFPPGFYILNFLGKALPWSLLLPAAFFFRPVRQAVRTDRPLLWLLCWTVGGLLFMECVPSKRFDRIFPVLPPACLLLAAAARHVPTAQVRLVAAASAGLAVLLTGGYSGAKVARAFRDNARGLLLFGKDVRASLRDRPDRLAVMNGKDEAMLMYVDRLRFHSKDDARELWASGDIDCLLLSSSDLKSMRETLEPFEVLVSVPRLLDKMNGYALIKRSSR